MSRKKLVVAMAWYRREQWDLLRAVSADADKLEPTYDQWHSFALRRVRDLEAKSLRMELVEA